MSRRDTKYIPHVTINVVWEQGCVRRWRVCFVNVKVDNGFCDARRARNLTHIYHVYV